MSADVAQAYAEATAAAFAQAADRVGIVGHDLRLADRPFRLRFAGSALADRLVPAFAHLDSAPADVVVGDVATESLSVDAWDRASTGIPAPRPVWSNDDYLGREQIRGFDDFHYDQWHGLLSVCGPDGGQYHSVDPVHIPRWVARMPFRHLIGSWAAAHGVALVHAAAVGVDGACVLLPGASGSGKSTTALTAAAHGLDFLGDDLCLVEPGTHTVHAPFALAKLEADALARLPSLRAAVLSTEEGQSMIAPPGLRRSARLVAIAVPRVSGETNTSWSPTTAARTLHAMAPSTLLEGNGGGVTTMHLMRELTEIVPCFDLALGTDQGGVVEALSAMVEKCR